MCHSPSEDLLFSGGCGMCEDRKFKAKPLSYLDRKVLAIIALLFACGTSYGHLHFTELSDTFGEESVGTRSKVLAVKERACGFTDHCMEHQSVIYTARTALRDRSGRRWESSV